MKAVIYELLDQTSDIRIRVYGNTIQDIIINCFFAFNAVIYSGKSNFIESHKTHVINFWNKNFLIVDIFSWLILSLDSFGILIKPEKIEINMDNGNLNIDYTEIEPLDYSLFVFSPKGATYNNVILNEDKGFAEITIDT
ncbi:MAG: archease [Thermoplasmataceae archaeon]